MRVSDVTRLYVAKTLSRDDLATMKTALRVAALPDGWKAHFEDRLAAM